MVLDYSSDRGTITLDRSTYTAYWPDDQVDAFGVFVTPGVDLEHVAQRIQQHFHGRYPLYVLTRSAFRERVLELVEQPFAVTYALEVIAIVVALLGVTNALYASILERTRELGVLRAVGATQRQVRRIILVEGGLMGLVGGCGGMLAGVVPRRHFDFCDQSPGVWLDLTNDHTSSFCWYCAGAPGARHGAGQSAASAACSACTS